MVPSLDAAADTTLALTTIDESLDTGQRDPRRTGRSAAAQGFRHKQVRSAGDSS
jgi:hypothetical protein